MNERIREFTKVSHLDVYGLGRDREKWESTVTRFADLIVRECADVMLQWKSEPFPMDPDLAADTVLQHFGLGS